MHIKGRGKSFTEGIVSCLMNSLVTSSVALPQTIDHRTSPQIIDIDIDGDVLGIAIKYAFFSV